MNIGKMLKHTWPEWEIVREIGAGSQGCVYMIRLRGHRDCLANYAALKVVRIPSELTASGRGKDVLTVMGWAREAAMNRPDQMLVTKYGQILRAESVKQMRDHPNLVRLQDWTVASDGDKGYMLLRMELLLPLDEYRGFDILRIGMDLCAALSELHRNGIFHLDVKPGNVFVTRDGKFKLGDYDSARNLYDLGKGDFPAGTLHYAAPELLSTRSIRSTKEDAVHADIYSLGMVLFELLTWQEYGRNCHGPADEAHEREEWFRVRCGYDMSGTGPVGMEDLSQDGIFGIRDVVRKALSFYPFLRYDSADQMLDAILDTAEARRGGAALRGRGAEGVGEAFDRFVHEDVRSLLILKYPSGVHRCFSRYPYVGELSGLRLTCAGHEPPDSVRINDAEIPFREKNGFIDLSMKKIFRDATWPLRMEIEARYPHGQVFAWQLIQSTPDRNWEWFKMSDWT